MDDELKMCQNLDGGGGISPSATYPSTHARMPREQSKPRTGNLLSGRGVDLLQLLEDVNLELGGLAVLVHVLDDLQRQNLVPERNETIRE